MSTRPTRNFPSTSEARCPDCGATLSRGGDLKRHRNTQHPDGTEVKAHCPYTGCEYETDQKSNLKAHINARHSNERRYPCPDCDRDFTDPAPCIRHRKIAHGYQPYHTPRYFARQALKKAEQKRGKAISNKTRNQRATSVSHKTQNASSLAATTSNTLTDFTYHNDVWKLTPDVPRRHASKPKDSQDSQISVPVAAAPACGAPKTLHSDFNLSSQEPQSHALAQSWMPYGYPPPVVASDHDPLAAAFTTSGAQSTYSGMSSQSLPTPSFTNVNRLGRTFLTAPTALSSSRVSGHQIVPLNHMATPHLNRFPA